MADHSLTQAGFKIERTFPAKIERVFKAFADKQAKELWFKGPNDDPNESHTMDFKVGGRESNSGTFHDGTVHRFEAIYYDIIPNERIIYTYEMYLNYQPISVSIATLEFKPSGDKTDLTLIENGVFLDNLDTVESREKGTHHLLDALESSLKD